MNTPQKFMVGGAIVASVIAGGAIGAAATGGATAATATPSDTSTTAPNGSTDQNCPKGHEGRAGFDRSQGGHVGENGTTEELLTGDTATKVTDAVKAQFPDATIKRVETDVDGAYEAHIVQADGTHATVKLDESFAITETDMGRGGR